MRTMYDSVDPTTIPADAQMVAGYVDPGGDYTWSAEAWARFPSATKVRIAGWASTDDGHVLDVEAGDATPDQAPGWCTRARARGIVPTVYCSEAVIGDVLGRFDAQGTPRPLIWRAAYPGGGPSLDPSAGVPHTEIAHQWANPDIIHAEYDVSVVADYWPSVDPAPATARGGRLRMYDCDEGNGLHTYWLPGCGGLVQIVAQEALAHLAAGVPVVKTNPLRLIVLGQAMKVQAQSVLRAA